MAATVGKSSEEKKAIIKDRKAIRRDARVFAGKQKKQKDMQKRMRKQNESIMKDVTTKRVPHGRGGIDAR